MTVAAGDGTQIGNLLAIVLFDALADDLAAPAGDLDRLIDRR